MNQDLEGLGIWGKCPAGAYHHFEENEGHFYIQETYKLKIFIIAYFVLNMPLNSY